MAESGQDKDIISQLADRGQDALARLQDMPGAQRFIESANQMRERAEELQKRLRGLDALERRVDSLEKKVDELSKSKASSSGKATTRRTTSAKPKAPGSGGNA